MTESLGFIATVTALSAALGRYSAVVLGSRSVEAIEVATARGFFCGALISALFSLPQI